MKKLFAIALCAAMALSMSACSSSEPEEDTSTQAGTVQAEEAEGDHTQTDTSADIAPAGTTEAVNPYIDCQTLEEAEELSGLTWEVPEEIGGSTERMFRAVENEMLEVIYKNGDAETARIRKAPGSDNISGNSEEFAQTAAVDVGVSKVTMKGQEDLFSLATWNDESCTYSVSLASGVSRDEMTDLVLSLQAKETV